MISTKTISPWLWFTDCQIKYYILTVQPKKSLGACKQNWTKTGKSTARGFNICFYLNLKWKLKITKVFMEKRIHYEFNFKLTTVLSFKKSYIKFRISVRMQVITVLKYFSMLKWFYSGFVIIMYVYCDFILVFILNLFTYLLFSTFLNLIVKNSCFWHKVYVVLLFRVPFVEFSKKMKLWTRKWALSTI